jgi:hypothetical protein
MTARSRVLSRTVDVSAASLQRDHGSSRSAGVGPAGTSA